MRRLFVLFFAAAFICGGCAIRTYSVYKPREDINLDKGNRGHLQGRSDEPAVVANPNRETKVVAIEFSPRLPAAKNPVNTPPAQVTPVPAAAPVPVAVPADREYTVLPEDTLQKISSKFYGTMHKWRKIYEANKEKIKAPDRIKPGQVLLIPADTERTDGTQDQIKKPL